MQISMKEVVGRQMRGYTDEIVEAIKGGSDFRWLEERAVNGLNDDLVGSASDFQSSLENIGVEDITVELEAEYESEAGELAEEHFGFNLYEAREAGRGDEWEAHRKIKLDELVGEHLEDAIRDKVREVLD